MQLRVAVRYSEYKSTKKLPSDVKSLNCASCTEKLQDKRNCEGFGNDKYKVKIGGMEFYQCPLSIPQDDAWAICDLIITSEETGIPVAGTCLLDQTKKFFEFRRYINSERSECHQELNKIREAEAKRDNKGSGSQRVGRKPPVTSRSRINK